MSKSHPRISVNKLAEYCEANPTRRKQIVQDAKNPPKFKSTRYSDARKAIIEYICELNEDIIHGAISSISNKPEDTEYQISDKKSSIEALEYAIDFDYTEVIQYDVSEFDRDNIKLNIMGVEVSVYPDLILSNENEIGAIKIHISKEGLTEESSKLVAVMLYIYLDEIVAVKGEKAKPHLCYSYDVFNERLTPSPISYKRRLQRLEAACEEIALWWETL
mgnify:CR=1 FL=1